MQDVGDKNELKVIDKPRRCWYVLLTICEKGQVVMVNSLCKQLHSVYPIEPRSILRQVPMTL